MFQVLYLLQLNDEDLMPFRLFESFRGCLHRTVKVMSVFLCCHSVVNEHGSIGREK